jgi:hypothetical protein
MRTVIKLPFCKLNVCVCVGIWYAMRIIDSRHYMKFHVVIVINRK